MISVLQKAWSRSRREFSGISLPFLIELGKNNSTVELSEFFCVGYIHHHHHFICSDTIK